MIAIKGMEMPKRCAKCKFCTDQKTNDYGSFGECLLQGNKKVNSLVWSRDADCPLVEIVTCKDCEHHEAIMAAKNTDGSEKIIHVCQKHGNIVSEDYYCADGTRKEDNYYIHLPGKDSNVVNGLPRSEEYFEERITGNPDFCNG